MVSRLPTERRHRGPKLRSRLRSTRSTGCRTAAREQVARRFARPRAVRCSRSGRAIPWPRVSTSATRVRSGYERMESVDRRPESGTARQLRGFARSELVAELETRAFSSLPLAGLRPPLRVAGVALRGASRAWLRRICRGRSSRAPGVAPAGLARPDSGPQRRTCNTTDRARSEPYPRSRLRPPNIPSRP